MPDTGGHGWFVLHGAGPSALKNTVAQPVWASDNFAMTEDEHLRAIIVGFTSPLIGFLLVRFKRQRPADRGEQRRSITNRLGYRLGALWARRSRRAKD